MSRGLGRLACSESQPSQHCFDLNAPRGIQETSLISNSFAIDARRASDLQFSTIERFFFLPLVRTKILGAFFFKFVLWRYFFSEKKFQIFCFIFRSFLSSFSCELIMMMTSLLYIEVPQKMNHLLLF